VGSLRVNESLSDVRMLEDATRPSAVEMERRKEGIGKKSSLRQEI
jgi:hypothetical protein